MVNWILRKRSIWFHIVVTYFTLGLWALAYFYFKNKVGRYESDNCFIIHSKVAGVSFKNDNGTDRQKIISSLKPGDRLKLGKYEFKPGEYAIGVYNNKGQQLGNINADLLEDIEKYLSENKILEVIAEVTGRDKGTVGCNIALKIKK